jgi:hypothetical protein
MQKRGQRRSGQRSLGFRSTVDRKLDQLKMQWTSKSLHGMMSRYAMRDPFEPVCFKALTYVDQDLVSTPGNSTSQFGTDIVYNLNSVWDPYNAGGVNNHNTSALGLAELTPIYSRYKVMGVEIRITFYHPHVNTITESNETTGLYAGIIVNNPAVTTTLGGKEFGRVSKLPNVWTKLIPPAGSNKVEFRQYFDMSTVFEMSRLQYDSDINNTTAGVGGNPGSLAQLNVALADSNGGAAAANAQVRVELTYVTQFYERKELTI